MIGAYIPSLHFMLQRPQDNDVGAITDSYNNFTWHFLLSRIFENY